MATDGDQSYVLFNYEEIQWGRTGSTVGFDGGDGLHFFNLATPSGKKMGVLLHFIGCALTGASMLHPQNAHSPNPSTLYNHWFTVSVHVLLQIFCRWEWNGK